MYLFAPPNQGNGSNNIASNDNGNHIIQGNDVDDVIGITSDFNIGMGISSLLIKHTLIHVTFIDVCIL